MRPTFVPSPLPTPRRPRYPIRCRRRARPPYPIRCRRRARTPAPTAAPRRPDGAACSAADAAPDARADAAADRRTPSAADAAPDASADAAADRRTPSAADAAPDARADGRARRPDGAACSAADSAPDDAADRRAPARPHGLPDAAAGPRADAAPHSRADASARQSHATPHGAPDADADAAPDASAYARADACDLGRRRRIFYVRRYHSGRRRGARVHLRVGGRLPLRRGLYERRRSVRGGPRRLQSSDDVEVGYHVLYPSADEAAAAAARAASHTAADFDGAVQSAAADAGVADVFAAASVEDVGTPAAATAGLDCYYLDWAGDGYCDEQNNVEECKSFRQGRLLRVDAMRLHRATTTCGETTACGDCVDPEVLALWSGCGWIESNSNTDGEQSVGQVSSPNECIAKVLDRVPRLRDREPARERRRRVLLPAGRVPGTRQQWLPVWKPTNHAIEQASRRRELLISAQAATCRAS